MPCAIELAPSAARDFKKVKRGIRDRIESKINSLANNPRPHGVEKLEGGDGFYRVRVGDFRIIYEIHNARLLVLVLHVADRKDVYRR